MGWEDKCGACVLAGRGWRLEKTGTAQTLLDWPGHTGRWEAGVWGRGAGDGDESARGSRGATPRVWVSGSGGW